MSDIYKSMPTRIKIGHYNFKLEVMDSADAETGAQYGHTCLLGKKIRFRPNMSGAELADTFIHEVLHAVNYYHDLKDEDTEETFVTRQARGLCLLWKENPAAMGWWVSLAQRAD